jgi:dsDNA-specific endonuclease/ATPase MutS2
MQNDSDEPFVLPITDTLDLHSVPPRDVKDVVEAWLDEVKIRGFSALRIIHGRGIGVQREVVRSILDRDADVLKFGDAPLEAGGWGATIVTLKSLR